MGRGEAAPVVASREGEGERGRDVIEGVSEDAYMERWSNNVVSVLAAERE